MTKEEFLSMINNELDNLEKEYQSAKQRFEYFNSVNPNGNEYQEAKFEFIKIQKKIFSLKKVVTLPAYARIQAMSDAEIEEYKKNKIEELELKIKEAQEREKQEKEKLSQLKVEQEQLLSQFGSLTGRERDTVITRGQQINKEISKYDKNNRWNVFEKIKNEIDKLRRQQEEIRAKTSEEIKQEISSKMEESNDLANRMELTSRNTNKFTELKALVAKSPKKAQEMAKLLEIYKNLSDKQNNIIGKMSLENRLHKVLEKKIREHSFYYNLETNEMRNPDKLMEIIQEFEEYFNQAKVVFKEQFTEEKLLKLVGITHDSINIDEIDMDFFQLHADKLENYKFEELQSLVEERNKLSKKIFKSKDIKFEIELLNDKIKNELYSLYKKIIYWYTDQCANLLDIRYLYFDSIEELHATLKSCKEDIEEIEQTVSDIKEKIQKTKEEMEQQRQNYEDKKTQIANKIRGLGDDEYKDTEILSTSGSYYRNLENIADAQNYVYQKGIVARVQQEAKNQADIKEAELRGITVEQLWELRNQESSQGKKR